MLVPALTSARGIAAWLIVAFHFREYLPRIGLLAQGYLSVDFFFELSGFVIALNYLDVMSWPGPPGRRIARFLWLRLGRIYPLHLFVLCLMLANPAAILLFSSSGDAGGRYDPVYFLLSLGLVQNWGFADQLAWNVPAWSISAEWAIYLLFPAAAWLVQRLRPSILGDLAALLALAMVLALWCAWSGLDLGAAILRGGVVRCATEFGIGIFVYRIWNLRRSGGKRLYGDIASLAALGLVAAYAVLPLEDVIVMPASFALLIYSMADSRSALARWLDVVPLQWVGLTSYSTYMIHYWVKDWVKILFVTHGGPQLLPAVVYLAATAGLSVLLYHAVEVPGRAWLRGRPPFFVAPFHWAARP
jgi:peptidoglycan/LPS O-acetylase OafA/YrhL